MSENKVWKRIDELNSRYWLGPDDMCIYYLEHTRGGFLESSENQLIFNLKMPVSYRDTARWKHKQSAIRQFAHDLNNLPFNDDILIPAATSKSEDDINYDSRIVDTLLGLKRINPSIHVLDILKVKTSTASAHSEGGTRRPYDIIEGLEPIENPPKIQQERIFVVDDILTTGGHFKAYKTFLERYYPNVQIIGIFWALHIF